MAHDIEQVRASLAAYRDRYGHDAVQLLTARFGPLSRLPENMFGQVIAATKLAPNSFEMSGHGDGDNIDSFQRESAANNADAQKYWDDRKAAQAKGSPAPSLPNDRHNARVAEKLRSDQDKARDLGANHDWKK